MNKVILVARLVRDPEVGYSQGEKSTAFARFSVAVDRRFKRDGDTDADFPNVVAFGKTAEFVEKYFKKGMRIGIVGRIQTGKYEDKDGKTVYTTDIVAEEVEFVESKGSGGNNSEPSSEISGDGFMNIPDGTDEELPFN